MKQNTLTNEWLCWIPNTAQAYYYKNKKLAKRFVDNVNNAFKNGELKIKNGSVIKIK